MYSHIPFSLQAFLVVLIFLNTRQASALIPRDILPSKGDLCYVVNSRSAILGSKLYFMGGLYTFFGGDTNSMESNMYWLDLNTSFPTEGLISQNTFRSVPVNSSQASDGAGVFFTDSIETMLYSFGGFSSKDREPANNVLLAYNTTSSQFTNVSVAGGRYNTKTWNEAMKANSVSGGQGLGFVSASNNGNGNEGNNQIGGGILTFNASDPTSPFWVNQTGPLNPSLEGASMQYVRYGKKGILVGIGGLNNYVTDHGPTGYAYDYQPLDQISVYDIDTKTWYNVTATGEVPQNLERVDFCTVVSSAPDDSSFNIVMYGGWNLYKAKAFDDVWVLSLPSFTWIKISDNGNTEAQLAGVTGRKSHNCELYNERQMIVLGGDVRIGSTQANGLACNISYPSIRVLDTVLFTWQTSFDPHAQPYEVPVQVYNAIGGGASDGSTLTGPKSGFTDPYLAQVFSSTVPRYTVSASNSGNGISTAPFSSGASANGSTGDVGTSSMTATGLPTSTIIIIAVVVPMVALIVIGLGLFFWRRHRRYSAPLPPQLDSNMSYGDKRHVAGELDSSERRSPQELESKLLSQPPQEVGQGLSHEIDSDPFRNIVVYELGDGRSRVKNRQ